MWDLTRQLGKARGAFVLLGMLAGTGCVSTRRYQALETALAGTAEAYRRTAVELERRAQDLVRAEAELSALRAGFQRSDQALAQARFETSVVDGKRADADALLAQLREELRRAGSHLEAFSDDRARLSAALAAAEAKASVLAGGARMLSAQALLLRDLALELGPRLRDGTAELTVSALAPVLRAESSRLLSEEEPELTEFGDGLALSIARVMQVHPDCSVCVADPAEQERTADGRSALAELLGVSLVRHGVDIERVRSCETDVASGPVELRFTARPGPDTAPEEERPDRPDPTEPGPDAPTEDVSDETEEEPTPPAKVPPRVAARR